MSTSTINRERDRDDDRIGVVEQKRVKKGVFFNIILGPQDELSRLQSQGRVAQLSAEDLQARLTEAYREREELARKLREAEEALGNKVCTYLYLPFFPC